MEKSDRIKLNILCISGVWTGAYPFFFEGSEKFKGMPAFSNVFLRLLNNPNVEKIHLLLFNKYDLAVNIPDKYKTKLIIHSFDFIPNGRLSLLFMFIKIIIKGIKVVRSEKIDRILGFGTLAGLGAIIGKLTLIKDFRRLYGTFLINDIKLSKLKLFLKNPLEYICFSFNGKALLITNDGTKGDLVFKKIGNKNMPFYFPLNGVDPNIAENLIKPKIDLPLEFMSYVARLDDWKRQHLLIEALGILKGKNVKFPKTFIIGAIFQKEYFNLLQSKIQSNNLESEIVIIDGCPINEVHYILKHSLITFSLYHTSNLGNVFLEAMKLGTPTVAINDTDSLSLVPTDAYFSLRESNPIQIADAIQQLLANSSMREQFSKNALLFGDSLKSWKDRAEIEINIMLD